MKKIRCMIAGTDWWDDCDDAAALRILAWAHCRGDIRLLGVALNACSPLSAPSLDAFLQGEGLHGIPIGLDRQASDFGGRADLPKAGWAPAAWSHRANGECEEGVALYRRAAGLCNGNGGSCGNRISSNIGGSFGFRADGYSGLNGLQLVQEKVHKLWMMAGKWDEAGGRENNFARNARSMPCGGNGVPVLAHGDHLPRLRGGLYGGDWRQTAGAG